MTQVHALFGMFISGIWHSIDIILKAHDVKLFKQVVLTVIEAEKVSQQQIVNNNNKTNNSNCDKSATKCHKFEKFGHYTNERRTKFSSFRKPNNGVKNETKQEHSVQFCRYC